MTNPENKAEREKDILARTRKAFGRSKLRQLNDRQTLEFYRVLRELHAQGAPSPYETVVRLIIAWNVFPEPNHDTLIDRVRKVGRMLFGRFEPKPNRVRFMSETPRPEFHPPVPSVETTGQVVKAEPPEGFDLLNETISFIRKQTEDYDFWRERAKLNSIPDDSVSKLAATLRLSLKDAWEYFEKLELIDKEALEQMRERFTVGTMNFNVLVQQNVDNPDNFGNFLTRFASEISALGQIEAQPESDINEQLDTHAADGGDGTSARDNASDSEEERTQPIGNQDS